MWNNFMISLILTLCLLGCSLGIFAQNAVADLHFESAEKAYNAGNYKEVLTKLNDTEKLSGPTSKTLYLRIITQDKVLKSSGLYADESNFELLTDLRYNAETYLEVMADQGLDDRYRAVFTISEHVKSYPQAKADWIAERDKLEAGRKLERELSIKRAEEQRLAVEFESIRTEQKSVYDSSVFPAAELLEDNANRDDAITVYIIRANGVGRSTDQVVFVNEDIEVDKLKPGQYIVLYCTSGLLRLGVSDNEEFSKRRKKRRTAAILAGGVIGLAATSGKVAFRNSNPCLLNLNDNKKSYYIQTFVNDDKDLGINYREISETIGRQLIENSELITSER